MSEIIYLTNVRNKRVRDNDVRKVSNAGSASAGDRNVNDLGNVSRVVVERCAIIVVVCTLRCTAVLKSLDIVQTAGVLLGRKQRVGKEATD